MNDKIHLRRVDKKATYPRNAQTFPFNVPALAHLEHLEFTAPVTFFVGENGSGKSTLLEALAVAAGLPAVGSEETDRDRSLAPVRELARHLKLTWRRRTHRGFFLRAEDFFGFARRLSAIQAELEAEMAALESEYAGRSTQARNLARMPYARELGELRRRYGAGLDAQSHGESFLLLFQQRFVPDGLYLLDEPEAPLSPLRQIGLLSLLKEMTAQGGQFIIATHSPILMAFPGAQILSFDHTPPRPIPWEELEHVTLTRAFLNDPQAFLAHL